MKRAYPCPVCGYGMEDQPKDYNICPSCGVEFGYSDVGRTFAELREEWIRIGMPWHSQYYKSPRGWNPQLQLLKSGLKLIQFSKLADNSVLADNEAPPPLTDSWNPQLQLLQSGLELIQFSKLADNSVLADNEAPPPLPASMFPNWSFKTESVA